MPATYAAVHEALREAASSLPDFQPCTMLDAGAGPGTATWAAVAVWPELQAITLIERDEDMAALGKRLAARSDTPALRAGNWLHADLTRQEPFAGSNIAVLSYALGELPQEKQAAVVRQLWQASEVMVILEPGTKAGFERVLHMRGMLLESGAAIAAPCPGNVSCPEASGWCHFSARVARTRLHRQAKCAELSYEDEKFAYLVVTKTACHPCEARVLRHPKIHKGHVELELCAKNGKQHVTVSKRMGEEYRRGRDLQWGDAVYK
jgi:ribosomal protein RSM22 (predicted rRNA methylase)